MYLKNATHILAIYPQMQRLCQNILLMTHSDGRTEDTSPKQVVDASEQTVEPTTATQIATTNNISDENVQPTASEHSTNSNKINSKK